LRFFHTLPIIPQLVALFQLHRFGQDKMPAARSGGTEFLVPVVRFSRREQLKYFETRLTGRAFS
jgi:hypothetical protein